MSTPADDADRIEELQAEIRALSARVKEAEAEITEIRFRDVPRYERGTVVLVPRTLFGKTRMWPSRIEHVSFHYSSGHYPETYKEKPGEPWETKVVSYSVRFQKQDGSFGGSPEGYWHRDLVLPPKAQDD